MRLALHPDAGTRRVVSHRVTNLLRAGDEMAVAERVLEFVESNWRRVRDVGATLERLEPARGAGLGPATAAYARWRAEALRHVGRFAEARDLADRARRAFAGMGDVKNEAHCMRLFGHILATQSISAGREHVSQALAKFDQLADNAGSAECELVLGEIDYFRGNHPSARDWLKQAAHHFSQLPDPLGYGRCLVLLAATDLAGANWPGPSKCWATRAKSSRRWGYRLGVAECEIVAGHAAHRSDRARRGPRSGRAGPQDDAGPEEPARRSGLPAAPQHDRVRHR